MKPTHTKKEKRHTHSFICIRLSDGSVRRECRCGEKVVDVASGKLTPEDKKRRIGGSKKRKVEPQPLF